MVKETQKQVTGWNKITFNSHCLSCLKVLKVYTILSDTVKCSTDFAVTLIKGDALTLQEPHSDVSVDIPAGIEGTFWRKFHTEFSRFLHIVPDEECFIGPVVELHLKPFPDEENGQPQYRIKIPHCLQTEEEMSLVKVRCGDTRRKIPFYKLQKKQEASGKLPYYEVDEHYVIVHTDHFSDHVCSVCYPYYPSCYSDITAYPCGNLFSSVNDTRVIIELFLCCGLYNIENFKSVGFFTFRCFVKKILTRLS